MDEWAVVGLFDSMEFKSHTYIYDVLFANVPQMYRLLNNIPVSFSLLLQDIAGRIKNINKKLILYFVADRNKHNNIEQPQQKSIRFNGESYTLSEVKEIVKAHFISFAIFYDEGTSFISTNQFLDSTTTICEQIKAIPCKKLQILFKFSGWLMLVNAQPNENNQFVNMLAHFINQENSGTLHTVLNKVLYAYNGVSGSSPILTTYVIQEKPKQKLQFNIDNYLVDNTSFSKIRLENDFCKQSSSYYSSDYY